MITCAILFKNASGKGRPLACTELCHAVAVKKSLNKRCDQRLITRPRSCLCAVGKSKNYSPCAPVLHLFLHCAPRPLSLPIHHKTSNGNGLFCPFFKQRHFKAVNEITAKLTLIVGEMHSLRVLHAATTPSPQPAATLRGGYV